MVSNENIEEAVEILQELGLKEYEAKCFVGLSRMETATARQLSDVVEVPRTRIYDAIRVLEAQGLVEVQHSSPQRFRAIPMSEAMETLRDRYENRIEQLRDALTSVEALEPDDESSIQEVWAMTGSESIENRTNKLIADADSEVVLVVGQESLLRSELVEELNALASDVDLLLGAVDESTERRLRDGVPTAKTFVSGLGWLSDTGPTEDAEIGRLLLVDRSTILLSSIHTDTDQEHAIFGTGFGNGLVVIARRIMSHGLLTAADPKQS